jgi:hypothetical protein
MKTKIYMYYNFSSINEILRFGKKNFPKHMENNSAYLNKEKNINWILESNNMPIKELCICYHPFNNSKDGYAGGMSWASKKLMLGVDMFTPIYIDVKKIKLLKELQKL